MGIKVKALIGIALAASLTLGGWMSRGWYEDSVRLAAEKAMQKTIDAAMKRESEVARVVEEKLSGLQASERVIDRGVIREIQKPIYQQVCLPDEMLDTINAEIRRGFVDEDTD